MISLFAPTHWQFDCHRPTSMSNRCLKEHGQWELNPAQTRNPDLNDLLSPQSPTGIFLEIFPLRQQLHRSTELVQTRQRDLPIAPCLRGSAAVPLHPNCNHAAVGGGRGHIPPKEGQHGRLVHLGQEMYRGRRRGLPEKHAKGLIGRLCREG